MNYFGYFVQRMERIDHNGLGFHYVVSYTRMKPAGPKETISVRDWRQERVEIDINHPDEPYQAYSIEVIGMNDKGPSPRSMTTAYIGYTGEDSTLKENYFNPSAADDTYLSVWWKI